MIKGFDPEYYSRAVLDHLNRRRDAMRRLRDLTENENRMINQESPGQMRARIARDVETSHVAVSIDDLLFMFPDADENDPLGLKSQIELFCSATGANLWAVDGRLEFRKCVVCHHHQEGN